MRSLVHLLDRMVQTYPVISGSISVMQELTIEVPVEQWHEVAVSLRDQFAFEQLIDLCGVDYSAYGQVNWQTDVATDHGFSRGVFDFDMLPVKMNADVEQRFAVVVHLLSIKHNQRLRVKIYCIDADFPVMDSVCDLWASANWFEREAFDLYGIAFNHHPDLRRILTDYGFVGHPLRKDFPLQGHVEMRFDIEQNRVIYEAVNLENRINTPRVIRGVERFEVNES